MKERTRVCQRERDGKKQKSNSNYSICVRSRVCVCVRVFLTRFCLINFGQIFASKFQAKKQYIFVIFNWPIRCWTLCDDHLQLTYSTSWSDFGFRSSQTRSISAETKIKKKPKKLFALGRLNNCWIKDLWTQAINQKFDRIWCRRSADDDPLDEQVF